MGQPRVAAERHDEVVVTPEIAAEAAVWVARLHGPDRSPQMERECLAWQARAAAHREAFERCTDTWQDAPRVTLASAFAATEGGGGSTPARRFAPRRWAFAVAAAGLLVGSAVFVQYQVGRGDYGTELGEQRQVVLDDGTRMSLNTDTRVRVEMGSTERRVRVHAGEALFDVAKDASRPFVVRAAESEVVAIGTVFTVRLTRDRALMPRALAVTLIEGQVTVRSAVAPGVGGVAPERPVLMQPGERVQLAGGATQGVTSQVDRPNIDQVVAWRRSEAVFDGTSLADAVAEMNRYSRTPIVLVDDSLLATLRVSGVYRTGDNAAFASAVAKLHGLSVSEGAGRLQLAKAH